MVASNKHRSNLRLKSEPAFVAVIIINMVIIIVFAVVFGYALQICRLSVAQSFEGIPLMLITKYTLIGSQ